MGTLGPASFGVGGSPQSGRCSRIESYADHIRAILRHGVRSDNALILVNLYISLARGIDYALSCNEIPEKANELPSLMKQVYHHNHDILLQSAIMLLMVSVKNACGLGWFCDKDASELVELANEISNNFSSTGSVTIEPNRAVDIISEVITRFYPWLKIGHIIVSLEAKVGYGILVADFYVPKSTPPSANERIRLFVAQADNTETSACIISPPEVSFLINGKGVDKRNSASMDSGPQFPTDVTSMLVYGTNLIQAIGNFNGNYIMVIAYVSMTVLKSDATEIQLPDYVQPALAATAHQSVDTEVIEGPSRISLNCPISFKRIKTPVKGQLCRHHPCFDYGNFLEINSRKPSWRCPHCNQPVSYCDLRLDQNVAKILQEVSEQVVDVLISGDGSWKVAFEEYDNNSHTDCQQKLNEASPSAEQQGERLGEGSHVVDLTMEAADVECNIIADRIQEMEDKKPLNGLQGGLENLSESPVANTHEAAAQVNYAAHSQMGASDDMWTTRLSSLITPASMENTDCGISGAGASVTIDNGLNRHSSGLLDPSAPSPILTDAVSPALNREIPQSQRNENPLLSGGGCAIRSSIPRHSNRIPSAVQALLAQTQLPSPLQPQSAQLHRLSRSMIRPISSSSGILPQAITSRTPASLLPSADGRFSSDVTGDMERQQSSRLPVHPPASDDHLHSVPNQSFQQIVGHPAASQVVNSSLRMMPSEQQHHKESGVYRIRSGSAVLDSQNLHKQQLFPGARVSHQTMNRSVAQSLPQPYTSLVPNPPTNSCNIGGHQQHNMRTSSPLGIGMTRPLTTGHRSSSFAVSIDSLRQPVPMGEQPQRQNLNLGSTEGLQQGDIAIPGFLSEQNWRPTGWMRGSLSGRAYAAGFGHLMVQPNASATVDQPRPLSESSVHMSQTASIPSLRQGIATNNINVQAQTSGGNPGDLSGMAFFDHSNRLH